MKLYFNPQSRAVIAKWMLDEVGAKYDIVTIDIQNKENRQPAFLRINPAGKLPALVDGDVKVFENVALGLYLGDKFPQAKLAPTIDAPERGRYLSLMVFSTSQLEPTMGDAIGKQKTGPERGWNDYETTKDFIELEIGEGPYLFGNRFTMADIMIGSMFIWMRMLNQPSGRPNIEAYVERLLRRPHAVKMPGPSK